MNPKFGISIKVKIIMYTINQKILKEKTFASNIKLQNQNKHFVRESKPNANNLNFLVTDSKTDWTYFKKM